jgi:DNA-binding protein HU-beta
MVGTRLEGTAPIGSAWRSGIGGVDGGTPTELPESSGVTRLRHRTSTPGEPSCHQRRKLPPRPRKPPPQRRLRRRLPSRLNIWPLPCQAVTTFRKKQAEAVLGDLVTLTTRHLKKGAKIRLTGLGILQVRKRAARMGRNPATGEAIKIKASKKIAFRPAKELKEAV